MGLFGSNSPFDALVDKATNENNTSEQWDVILEICDKVGHSSKNSKESLQAIVRRLNHTDPHVGVQAVTLLDACINNCGKNFHLEVASREFQTEFLRLLQRSTPVLAHKLRLALRKWAENEFKTDAELNLIPTLYQKLRSEGADFQDMAAGPATKVVHLSKDPNVVSSQKEQDDIALAIELSLKENNAAKSDASGGRGSSPKQTTTTTTGSSSSISNPYASLYSAVQSTTAPTTTTNRSPQQQQQQQSSKSTGGAPADARKVRALYDFEAAEDNELTFLAGEIIHVTDDSDQNWWKGYNQRGDGLFPSNFVTADLSAEPERLAAQEVADAQQSAAAAAAAAAAEAAASTTAAAAAAAATAAATLVDIDEDKIDRLLHLLSEANPEDPKQDTDEMLRLEEQVNRMLPLIDTELERVDRKHAQLTQLSSDLVDAINLYHLLMREPDRQLGAVGAAGYGSSSAASVAAGLYGAGGSIGLAQSMQSMALGGHQNVGVTPPHVALAAAAARFAPMMSPHHPNVLMQQQQQQQQQSQHQLHHQQHASLPSLVAAGGYMQHHVAGQLPQQDFANALPSLNQAQVMHPHQQQQQQQQQQHLHHQHLNNPTMIPSNANNINTTAAASVLPIGGGGGVGAGQQQAGGNFVGDISTTQQQQQQQFVQQQYHQQQQHHHHHSITTAPTSNGIMQSQQQQHPSQQQQHPSQQQQPQQQIYTMSNGGQPNTVVATSAAVATVAASSSAAGPVAGQFYMNNYGSQQPQPIYQQQQYASITQPITNTILPPIDGNNMAAMYQQQR